CFGRSERRSLRSGSRISSGAAGVHRGHQSANPPTSTVEEFNAKCFCIFGMVQHIFPRIDLSSQDAASTFFNEML
ncbi:hypothetical protein, partial [Pseudomonas cyclaminis]|uniref:hypothetical protein n=1 Tax=Pseudomonas cyclaminis TaxID=2781239 RepID=UPI0019D54B7C